MWFALPYFLNKLRERKSAKRGSVVHPVPEQNIPRTADKRVSPSVDKEKSVEVR